MALHPPGPLPTVKALVLYDSGNPTAAEQLVLEYINRARADPSAEGSRLGIDIHEGLPDPTLVGPRPPLAMNKILLTIANAHSQDMYTANYFSHNDLNGTSAFDRIGHAGYNYVRIGENMAAAGNAMSAGGLEDFMMIDSGTQGRPHRVNLLDLTNAYPCGTSPCVFYEIGIGYFDGNVPNGNGLTSLITEDFGTAPNSSPFLLGVVFNDRNGNNFYDIGEGLPGITISTSTGNYYAVTSSSGGYAIPIGTSGTISITASGPGFGPITKMVTLSGSNVKVDFTSQGSTLQTTNSSTTTITSTQVTFQSTPSNFVGGSNPGAITACGGTYVNSQATTACGKQFQVAANLPTPSTGWQFNHWSWSGGVTCNSNSVNPVSCSASGSGSLMATFAAQITVMTNPSSSALISWNSCSGSGQGNGSSFFSTNFGVSTVTACSLPSGYAVASWSCSGEVTCSGSSNSTVISFNGPGTIILYLRSQLHANATSTVSRTTSQVSSSTASVTTPEFGADQMLTIVIIMVASTLLLRRRRRSAKVVTE